MGYTRSEETVLVRIARRSIEAILKGRSLEDLDMDPCRFSAALREKKAVFVSLILNSELRGSAGYLMPLVPLWQATMENARNAAFRDPRFTPLWRDELPEVEIVVHVVSRVMHISAEDKFNPREEGFLLRKGSRMALFLPMPWRTPLTPRDEVLSRLCREVAHDSGGSTAAEERERLILEGIIREQDTA